MEINRKEFLEVLNLSKTILANNTIHPILGCFCFTGERLITFNGIEASAQPCKTDFIGGVPGILHALISKYTGETIILEQKKGTLQIKCGRSKDELVLVSPETFLWSDLQETPIFGLVYNKTIQDALTTLLLCASKNTLNTDTNGVYLSKKGRCLQLFSTNGDVIGIKRMSSLRLTVADFTLLIPYHFIGLCSHLDFAHNIVLEVYTDKLCCIDNDSGYKVTTQLTESPEIPECLTFIEKAEVFLGMVAPENLIEALDRALSLEKSDVKPIHFKIEPTTLTLSVDSPLGHVEEQFEIDSDKDFELVFNGADIFPICKASDITNLEFCTIDATDALMLRTGDSKDDYKFLISSLVI